jgi:rod shape-determining protein MreB
VNEIVEAVHEVLENTPPELAADISNRGILMTGGGALLYGLDKLIEKTTGITTKVADNPVECVAIGTGKSLDWVEVLEKSMQDGQRSRFR